MLSELNSICGDGSWRKLTEAAGDSQLWLRVLDRLEWLGRLGGIGLLEVRVRAEPPLTLTLDRLDLLGWVG